ncbi:hypothetical protein P3S67_021563 [Capsicum chacoense]
MPSSGRSSRSTCLSLMLPTIGLPSPKQRNKEKPSGKMDLSKMDSEIYEIDYRGPETHTYIPPPKGSRGKHNFHHQSMLKHHRKFKGLKASKLGEISGEKIHG